MRAEACCVLCCSPLACRSEDSGSRKGREGNPAVAAAVAMLNAAPWWGVCNQSGPWNFMQAAAAHKADLEWLANANPETADIGEVRHRARNGPHQRGEAD